MCKIQVNEDGIPYIHYLPRKTLRANTSKTEIEIPIMKYALDIIKKWRFKFKIIHYAAGLHQRGSQAVHHYTKMELRNRFARICLAFNQPLYKVDKDLNVIEEN